MPRGGNSEPTLRARVAGKTADPQNRSALRWPEIAFCARQVYVIDRVKIENENPG
jgi:hypothetical protein